jgi:hypothetical protein
MRDISTIWLMVALMTIIGVPEIEGQEQRQTRPRRTTSSQPTPPQEQRRTRPRQITTDQPAPPHGQSSDRDWEIAAHFAPVIHQGLDGNPRFDYITNFNFDGDWRGDNNWTNAENPLYPLRAYVYYSVIETDTHYFIHYAAFHPRDYKGGLFQSWLLAEAMRQAKERLKNLPEGAEDLALSHENDLEGCLVVAEKRGQSLEQAAAIYVETMAHNEFNKYYPPNKPSSIGYVVEMEGSHVKLFSEPKGHGLLDYTGRPNQLDSATRGVLVYHHTGQPEDPEQAVSNRVGYRLVPIFGTLWQRAQMNDDEMYGETADYGTITITALENGAAVEKSCSVGRLGAAFRGVVGAENKARSPWAWFDYRERNRPPGEWFFDPAATIKRHFYAYSLSTTYVHNPYLQIWREAQQ